MRLLILGTGGMANQHAKHFAAIDGDPARTPWISAGAHLLMAAVILSLPARRRETTRPA